MTQVSNTALVSLEEVKEALEITGNTHDAKLGGYINRATAIIESYCGRNFKTATQTEEEFSGNGTNKVALSNWPIQSITRIEQLRNADYANPQWDELNARDYTVIRNATNNGGLLYFVTGVFTPHMVPGIDNYRITYVAGYDTIPDDIKEAAIEIVSYLFNSRRSNPLMKSENLQKYSYTKETIAEKGIIAALGLSSILVLHRNITV